MTAPAMVMLYVPTSDAAEAERIAAKVVGERLAACANILPGMTSFYWWQGKMEKASEVVLILKTRPELAAAASAAVKAAHSYTVPCISVIEVVDNNPDYLTWLKAETVRPEDRP